MRKKRNVISICIGAFLLGGMLFGFSKGDDRNFQIVKSIDVFNAVFKELDNTRYKGRSWPTSH